MLEREPEQLAGQRRGFGAILGHDRGAVRVRAMPDLVAAPTGEQRVQGEADRPPVGLGLAGELGFEHERVDEQGEERAESD